MITLMEAFEQIVAQLLAAEGYWTTIGLKVQLTKAEKVEIGKPSLPRPELDVVAYKPTENELLVVECKSFLDSPGLVFRKGQFGNPKRYKLFVDPYLRQVVFERLKKQLYERGACLENPRVILCLAAAHIANKTDRKGLQAFLEESRCRLLDVTWVRTRLKRLAKSGYQNDAVHMTIKILGAEYDFQP